MNTAFDALPHVNQIWVTKDGHFHLHPHNGGELVERNTQPTELIKEPLKKGRKPKVNEE
ncbi:hypothetical protein UFOVP129_31 [uncultured Caudovirales phage]|uniref:Uncharacterized protein n=1 Tax=uncultured Caudovirales phage TaxID=2100421 RepID=A0A6J5L8P9_9CAUD|nr:hypothetical protein UFOVP129_31 [uncultured Caudovirales phage]